MWQVRKSEHMKDYNCLLDDVDDISAFFMVHTAQVFRRVLANASQSTPRARISTKPQTSPAVPPVTASGNITWNKLLVKYPRLAQVASRSDVPIPSLAISFALLHELTALVPLVILFFAFQTIGAGSAIVQWAGGVSEDSEEGSYSWRGKVGSWLEEGERRVEKVGRRYGLLGFEKGSKIAEGEEDLVHQQKKGMLAAGSITNAVAAYLVVKALLPARIGLSIWAAPGFARRTVEPLRLAAKRLKASKTS